MLTASSLLSLAQAPANSIPDQRGTRGPVANRNALTSKDESESSDKILSAQFQATVYEVHPATNQLASLDSKSLARQATTADTLLKALSGLGGARILYRVDQAVNVYAERITIGESEPMVTGVTTTATGQSVNSIAYRNVGIIVRLSAHLPTPETDKPTVRISVQLSVLRPSDTEIAPGRTATSTRNISLEHQEPLTFNQPQVAISVKSTSDSEQTTPTAYIIRYMFTPPLGK
jgi:hypothetical protein